MRRPLQKKTAKMKRIFDIKENFAEEFLIRFISVFLIILGSAIISIVFDKYSIFLKALPFLAGFLAIFALTLIVFNRKIIKLKENKADYLILLFIFSFCIFNAFHFSESLIESGHDQGGYFNTAVLLSNTGKYYENYSENPISLTMPGYLPYENNIVRWHFIPGGPAYFSIFYSLFGISGFPISLSFALFLSTAIIYFLCKKLRNWKAGFFFVLFFLFNFYTMYFSRSTWVENIQLLLVWFAIFLFIKGWQAKKLNYLIYAFLPLSIMMMFRLETMLYLGVYFLAFLFQLIFNWKKYEKTPSIWAISLIIFALFFSVIPFIFDSEMMLRGESSPVPMILSTLKNPTNADIALLEDNEVPYNQQFFVWVFLYYLFRIPLLIILVLGLLNFFIEEKETKKAIFIIAFLISPQFVFLIRPSIALYIPWAVRRFWPVLYPFAFMVFSLYLTNPSSPIKKSGKVLSATFIILMFTLSAMPSISILTLKQGAGIINYEEQLASEFNKEDVVIFFDLYGTEKWGPNLHFLYNTNVIFDQAPAFDKEIYALFFKNYKNVYIATSFTEEKVHPYFDGNLEFVKTLESPVFKILNSAACDVRRYNTHPERFSNYTQITEICDKGNPPSNALDYQIKINIYKLNDSFKEEFTGKNYNENYTISRNTKEIWS